MVTRPDLSCVRLWALSADEVRAQDQFQGHVDDVLSVAFAPDGKHLASSDKDGRVIVWDAAGGKKLHEWRLPGRVPQVVFAPDGRHLVTVNGNGTAYVLRLPPP